MILKCLVGFILIPQTSLDVSLLTADMETQQIVDVQAPESLARSSCGRTLDHEDAMKAHSSTTPEPTKVVSRVSSPTASGPDLVTNCDCGVNVIVALGIFHFHSIKFIS